MLTMLPFLRQVIWPQAPDDTHARVQWDQASKVLLIPTTERTERVELGDYVVIENAALRVIKKDHPNLQEYIK